MYTLSERQYTLFMVRNKTIQIRVNAAERALFVRLSQQRNYSSVAAYVRGETIEKHQREKSHDSR